ALVYQRGASFTSEKFKICSDADVLWPLSSLNVRCTRSHPIDARVRIPYMTRMDQQTQALASEADDNPLFAEWGGPFGVPAFDRIRPEHFRPALAPAFAAHAAEVAAIAGNANAPTFANTVDALESSGEALTRAVDLFHLLAGAHTNDAILAIERELAPLKAKHW